MILEYPVQDLPDIITQYIQTLILFDFLLPQQYNMINKFMFLTISKLQNDVNLRKEFDRTYRKMNLDVNQLETLKRNDLMLELLTIDTSLDTKLELLNIFDNIISLKDTYDIYPSYFFFHPTLAIDSKKVFLHIPLDDLLSDKIPKLEGYMKIPDDLKMETSFPISTYITYEEIFIKRSYNS